MAQKQFKIGLSNTDKQNMAQDVYERVLALTFNEYDTTTEYEIGDFVVYNDQLYKCIGATSGAWDSTKWQLATLNDLVTDIESAVAFVNDKANVNGNYPTMTVGFADNLTPYDESAGDDQDEPFSFQATGTGNGTQPDFATGSGALMKEKQGNTVVVNQLNNEVDYTVTFLDITITCSNGLYTINGTANGNGGRLNQLNKTAIKVINGHKYLIYVSNPVFLSSGLFISKSTPGYDVLWSMVDSQGKFVIYNCANTEDVLIGFNVDDGEVIDNVKTYIKLFDLTQMYGSNDNIPADLIAHPENFFRYYQGSLAYNEGELVNANGRYIKCIGMNQWDEECESGYYDPATGNPGSNHQYSRSKNYFKVIPNTDYYCVSPDSVNDNYILWHDKDKNFVGRDWFGYARIVKSPANACYAHIYFKEANYNNDISINLYYEDEPRCLTYEPYEVLTNNDTGTEVLRSAGSVKDSKDPDGTIHRLVGSVDLSTITFAFATISSSGGGVFYATLTGRKIGSNNLIANKYSLHNSSAGTMPLNSILGSSESEVIYICVSQTSGTINGEGTLFYELAEPTTEQGTPYSENLVIDDFGSMDFGSDVPQGNLIFYPVDYKAFVDTLYKYTEDTPSNIALKSDLSADKSELQGVDTQLKNALGGTLRQCLCVKESLDFDNTDVIDLGTLNYAYDSDNHLFSVDISGMYINDSQTIPHIICTKYKTVESGYYSGYADKDKIVSTRINNAKIIIKDTTYTDGTIFKNAMKGVLLAYEKASE